MNGFDAAKEIRAAGFKDVPIIALSANAAGEEKETAEKSGMNDYITKPINREVMLGTIQNYLGKKT